MLDTSFYKRYKQWRLYWYLSHSECHIRRHCTILFIMSDQGVASLSILHYAFGKWTRDKYNKWLIKCSDYLLKDKLRSESLIFPPPYSIRGNGSSAGTFWKQSRNIPFSHTCAPTRSLMVFTEQFIKKNDVFITLSLTIFTCFSVIIVKTKNFWFALLSFIFLSFLFTKYTLTKTNKNFLITCLSKITYWTLSNGS